MFPSRPRRLPSFSYRGPWRYSLTFCCAHRHDAFVDPRVVSNLTSLLLRTAAEQQFEVVAYCFMPNHLHLLVEGLSDDSELVAFCRLARQRLAHAYARCTSRPLWQPGYWEHVLREGDTSEACALYIVGNPLRKKLAQSIGDYPYSGGTWFDKVGGSGRPS